MGAVRIVWGSGALRSLEVERRVSHCDQRSGSSRGDAGPANRETTDFADDLRSCVRRRQFLRRLFRQRTENRRSRIVVDAVAKNRRRPIDGPMSELGSRGAKNGGGEQSNDESRSPMTKDSRPVASLAYFFSVLGRPVIPRQREPSPRNRAHPSVMSYPIRMARQVGPHLPAGRTLVACLGGRESAAGKESPDHEKRPEYAEDEHHVDPSLL